LDTNREIAKPGDPFVPFVTFVVNTAPAFEQLRRLRSKEVCCRGPCGIGYNRPQMQLSDPSSPAEQAIASALSRIERRLRLNRTVYQGMLVAGLALLVPLTVRVLRWLGDGRPVETALLLLFAVLAAVALLCLVLASALRQRSTLARAAAEADARAQLKDELTSAYWFMQALPGSDWVGAQLERAARTAHALEPARLIPLRLPAPALGALALAVVALGLVWSATPLAPAGVLAGGSGALSPAEQEQLRALRTLADALPGSEAAFRLEQALQTLERTEASAQERSRALAQAQDAVQQIRLDAASTREALHRAAEALRDQPGMQAVAEALSRGDAQQAAELLGRMQEQVSQAAADKPPAPEPVSGGAADKSLEQALLDASEVSGPQPEAVSPQAMQQAVDRLNEIARELSAANYVNQAWEKARGPQFDVAQRTTPTASPFAEQTAGNSPPSPASGETPTGGDSMFRPAAVAEGKGRTEQEGGTRAGDALGDAAPDPLLGAGAERLEGQLKQAGLPGPEAESKDSDAWFYAQTRAQKASAGWRSAQARARFAEAQAGSNEGISIQHRQIVKDYFMNLREGGR
jgi:exonuclease VII small subunit